MYNGVCTKHSSNVKLTGTLDATKKTVIHRHIRQ